MCMCMCLLLFGGSNNNPHKRRRWGEGARKSNNEGQTRSHALLKRPAPLCCGKMTIGHHKTCKESHGVSSSNPRAEHI